MKPFSSLRSRIWLAVGATALPIFVFSLFGYLERREEALREVERDIGRMLRAALVEERVVVDNARQVLRIMARSDDLRTLDAAACSGIAARLLDTQTNFANIGAALPDGRLFCSGLPMKAPLSAVDRDWFKSALEAADMTRGHYQLGRITGQRGIAFGYPLRDVNGKLRAVLFASTGLHWLERMTEAVVLPEGWFALAVDGQGRILARHPELPGARNEDNADPGLLQLVRTLSADAVRELIGRDGGNRIYGIAPLNYADAGIHLVIGAPTDSALDPVDRAFYRDLGVFALVFLASALLGWLEFRRSFVGWAERMSEAVHRIGSGEPLPPEATASPVRELAELSSAFAEMKLRLDTADRQRRAGETAVRESEQRLRLALETGNEGLWDWDVATGLAYFSPTWYSMLGYEPDEFPASFAAWQELLHPADREDVPQRLLEAVHGGTGFEASYRMRNKQGEWRWLHGRAAVVARDAHGHPARVVGTHVDVTERRRREDEEKARAERVEVLLALNEHSAKHLEKEFLAFGLEAAETLTASRLGFLHFVNEDQEHLDLVAWSEATRHDCLVVQAEHYPISQAGVWADCFRRRAPVVVNDYAALAAKKGAPPGHVRMDRLLTVPVIADDKVRAIVGVGNKAEDYGTADIETLQLIGSELWRIVRARRTERSLAESERRLRAMLENVDMVAVILDRQGRVVFINDYWTRITGWMVAEALGQDWFGNFLPESAREPAATFEQTITAGDMPAHLENEILTRDGARRRIAWNNTLSHDATGELLGTISLGEDVTEKRAAEIALAESWERFYSIVNTISEAILLHDAATGRIVDVNDAATQMYGYSRDELLQMDVGAISASEPPYTQEAAGERMRRALAGEPQSFEWHARRRDGSLFWVEVNLRFAAIDGKDHVLGVVQDISERRAYEIEADQHLQKLVALNKKLEDAHMQLLQSEKMASIGQLAAGVAHEINNPVGYVYSNIGSLEKYLHDFMRMLDAYEQAEPALPEAARAEVQRLRGDLDLAFLKQDVLSLLGESREGINRVRKIVQDLKDFSRVGSADEWQWADLHAGLDSTLNIVWNELKYKTTVERRYGELPQVYCLPSQINQVFMNLLVNAAHAIETQGVVTLRTGRAGEEVWIEVEDTGSGIAPENLKRIFDPFFTTKPVGKGTGLGLSVSYSIVQKHQGRIEVRSEVGKGSAFRVWLPIAPQPADTAATPGAT